MKILCITRESFPTFRVDISELLGKEFSLLGHKIDWVFSSDDNVEKRKVVRWYNHIVVIVPNKLFGKYKMSNIFTDFIKCFYIFKMLFNKSYDFIKVKDEIFIALFALIINKFSKCKYVYWLSFPIPDAQIYDVKNKPIQTRWAYWLRGEMNYFILYKIIMKNADIIIAQSEQMKKDLVLLGISSDKILAVPMGVQMREIDNDNNYTIKNRLVIGYLGTLSVSRHLDFLVDVLDEVLKYEPSAKLLLVGDGDNIRERELILNRAKELNVLDNIEITGFLEREVAWERLSESAVCLSPFYPINFLLSTSPTKLLEYMVLGIPSVANIHPEQKKILNESGAGLCVPWKKEDFDTRSRWMALL